MGDAKKPTECVVSVMLCEMGMENSHNNSVACSSKEYMDNELGLAYIKDFDEQT